MSFTNGISWLFPFTQLSKISPWFEALFKSSSSSFLPWICSLIKASVPATSFGISVSSYRAASWSSACVTLLMLVENFSLAYFKWEKEKKKSRKFSSTIQNWLLIILVTIQYNKSKLHSLNSQMVIFYKIKV